MSNKQVAKFRKGQRVRWFVGGNRDMALVTDILDDPQHSHLGWTYWLGGLLRVPEYQLEDPGQGYHASA